VQTAPSQSIIKYEFPARAAMGRQLPPCTLYWYDGGLLPERPKDISPDIKLGEGDNGSLFIGEKGYAACGTYGGQLTLLPEDRYKDYERPEETIPRVGGPYRDFIDACKGLRPACSNFDYSGPLTETVLLGNIALRVGGKIEWDSANMRITNNEAANQFVNCYHREGWPV
jgi:hypothetical protein